MKYLAAIALFAALAASASAALPRHPGQQKRTHQHVVGVSVLSGPTAQTAISRPIPNIAAVVNVSFNGHAPAMQWSDSSSQIESVWGGVIVLITAKKGTQPAVVRVASTREDPVRVYVRFSW